ncbi:MAG: hypothetical protein HQL45_10635 [Alphaproteobacteria bacterium]|nr:hypothetical protein [Alphaproteobacteria bacterium]
MRAALVPALLLTVLAQALSILTQVSPLGTGRLVDGDCYMRLARVEALMHGNGWYDATTTLLNAPWGEALHWTRPFDLLIALAAFSLTVAYEIKDAVWLAGLWISPLLEFLAVAALIWGLKPHLKTGGLILAAALFVFQPSIMGVFLPARPDHHSLQILLEICVLAGLMRPGLKSTVLAGLAAALALWVSAEALLLILASGLALGLAWMIEGAKVRRRLIAFTLALALGATLALVIERPPSDWLLQEFDRLSLVQVSLCWFLTLSTAWLAFGNDWACTWQRRLLLGTGMAAQAAGLMALAFPHFFAGPYGNLDPRLVPIWFSLVKEAQPISFGAKSLILLAPPILALLYASWRLIRTSDVRQPLLAAFCALLVYTLASLHQVRIAAFAQAADIAPWTLLVLAALGLGRMKVVAVPLVLVGHLLAAVVIVRMGLGVRDPGAPDICSWDRLAAHLQAQNLQDRRPILTYIFPGPELAYLSGHPVVAGPYHRSTEGILDIVGSLSAKDDAFARDLVLKRKIGLIALCDGESEAFGFTEKGGEQGFHAKLLRGDAPGWLKAQPVPNVPKGRFVLYEVIP